MKKVFMTIAAAMMAMFTFAATPVTVADAVAAMPANDGDVTTAEYVVCGFVSVLYNPYSGGVQSFYMDDTKGGTGKQFEAYKCTLARPVTPGAYVKVTGKIKNFKGTAEIESGTVEIEVDGDPLPVLTVAQAVAKADLITDPTADGKTTYGEVVIVRGYTTWVSELSQGQQRAWLADKSDAAQGDIQVWWGNVSTTIAKGDYVEVYGQLAKNKYNGEVGKRISNGTMTKSTPSAVENVNVETKAVKVMENGQLYILRDGVKYNAAGVVVE